MKKQIIFISLALCALSARATVQPIYPGENLWKIISRLGTTVDIIESCFDVLDQSTLDCTELITQDDIPFTITAPGVYCLAENVTVPASSVGIFIQSECVELDLCGHTIDGEGSGLTSGVVINVSPSSTLANVVVKNGLIKRCARLGLEVASIGPVKLSNIKATNNELGITMGISRNGPGIGVTLEDCESSENQSRGFWVFSDSRQCVFNNCIARDNGDEGFFVQGFFNIEGDEDCCFVGCKSFGNGGVANFYVKHASHNVFIDCVATGAQGTGVAETGDGFRIEGPANSEGYCRDNVLFHCIASNNAQDGFQIHDAQYNVIRDCVANTNGRIGINIGTGPSAWYNQVMGCSCVGNTSFGIEDDPGSSLIVNNIAHDNNSGGAQYNNVNAVDTSADLNTGYWANVAG